MKHRLLLTLSACALMFCLLLTACGQQNTNGAATKDSATADSAETVSAAAPANTPTAEPAKEADSASSSASSSAASPAQNTPNVVGNSDDIIVHEEDTPAQEEQQEEPEQEEQRSSSSAPAPQSSSKASPASQGNPAYADDEKPIFTITLTNKSTKKSYSASCNYTTDKEEAATAAFFLPGGEYDIAVYNYTESKDKGDPVAQATYKNNIANTKRRSVHVNYTPKDKKIEVTVSASSRTQ
ncbi:MAG: hypothetical protein IJI19_08450 [Ruminococcus sp.]|nr:hypothetical protein [Ruminococcus sp.]